MPMNIERLLYLTADYHNFCSDSYTKGNEIDSDELNIEELDFIAAAQNAPINDFKADENNGINIR